MNLEELTAIVEENVQPGGEFPKKIAFDFGEKGRLFIDGGSGQVDNSDSFVDATINITWDNFFALLHGKLDPMESLQNGTIKVDGDMAVLAGLDSIMEDVIDAI